MEQVLRCALMRGAFAVACALAFAALPAHAALTVTTGLSVPAGREFTLEASMDGETGQPSFQWRQVKGPVKLKLPSRGQGRAITLSSRWPGEYVFECTASVGDGNKQSAETRVLVTPAVVVPTAVISGELVRKAGAGQWVFLSGEESHDPAGRRLQYKWLQVSGPVAKVREGTYQSSVLEFLPDAAGRYVFALQVEAGRERSEAAVAIVEVPVRADGTPDHAPVIAVEYPENAARGQSIVLDGSATQDPDGDATTVSWLLVDGPSQKGYKAEGKSIEFVPEANGLYRFRVEAKSGELTASKEIAVRVTEGAAGRTQSVAPAQPLPGTPAGLSVAFRTESLDEVLAYLGGTLGIAVRIDPRWMTPAEYSRLLVDLKLDNVSEEMLLTALARILGGRYHPEGARAYWLERGYSFIGKEAREPLSVPAPGAAEADALAAFIEETVKPAILFGGGNIAPSPDGRSVIGLLPASATARVNRVLSLVSAPTARGAAGAPEPVCAALTRPVRIKAEKAFLRDVIWDVARQAEVSIGYRASELPDAGLGSYTLDEGPMTLAAALKRIMALAGLAGYRVDAPNVLWLYAEDPGPPGPSLWDASREAAFDVSGLLKKKDLTGSLIAHLVKKRVAPRTWFDPATAAVFLPAKHRLIVVNHPLVIGMVAKFLAELEKSGHAYLGPEE
jgi:hypothetical protein